MKIGSNARFRAAAQKTAIASRIRQNHGDIDPGCFQKSRIVGEFNPRPPTIIVNVILDGGGRVRGKLGIRFAGLREALAPPRP